MKKWKEPNTVEGVGEIIRVATLASGVGEVLKTSLNDGLYTVEFEASTRFQLLGRNGPDVLAKSILTISVTVTKYLDMVKASFEEVRVICHVGKDVHVISTPTSFLRSLVGKDLWKLLKDWIDNSSYNMVRNEKK